MGHAKAVTCECLIETPTLLHSIKVIGVKGLRYRMRISDGDGRKLLDMVSKRETYRFPTTPLVIAVPPVIRLEFESLWKKPVSRNVAVLVRIVKGRLVGAKS